MNKEKKLIGCGKNHRNTQSVGENVTTNFQPIVAPHVSNAHLAGTPPTTAYVFNKMEMARHPRDRPVAHPLVSLEGHR